MTAVRDAVESGFYEARHEEVGGKFAERYIPLYEAAAALIPEGASVVELGCGAGKFAPYALARTGSYLGLDFAPALIDAAEGTHPGHFAVADLRTDPIPEAQVYVALEVLEHLDDDLGLLARLPRGATAILSVPSFDSASHVRWFPEPGSAKSRYERWLYAVSERTLSLPSGAFFHLLAGTVRAREKTW